MDINKIIKMWGDSHVIVLSPDDRKILGNANKGDIVNVSRLTKIDKNTKISDEDVDDRKHESKRTS